MGTLAGDQPGSDALTQSLAGPTLSRIILGMRLRRYRQARGVTREEAGDAIRATSSKISRLELGRVGVKLRDVIDLCELYGVCDLTERATLLGLARQSNMPGWWVPYSGVIPPWFELLLGLEQTASVIRSYEVQFMPGLLQTPDYALSLIKLAHGGASDADLELRLELQMRRQQILYQDQPPHLWVVIDQAVLFRPVGGRATMSHQLRHLIDVCDMPRITVQILPFAADYHVTAGGAITLLRLPEPGLPDIVYLEQLTTALYINRTDEATYYRHVLNLLAAKGAAPPVQTPSILRRITRDL